MTVNRKGGAQSLEAAAKALGKPIVLIGLMGAGKTTVGRRLATRLRCRFVDTDAAIEEAARLSVSEIFDAFGEAYFRDGERRVIARLLDEGPGVIATGGGAFCQDETRRLILEQGLAVWLDCDTAILAERTGRRNTRPLLQGGDRHEILARLAAERRPLYRQAQVHVRAGDGPHTQTVEAILQAVAQWR